jgi:hypothetical protein
MSFNPTVLRKTAATLYGEGLSDTAYIAKLAVALGMTTFGVHKWWYGQRKVSGPAKMLLERLKKEEPTAEKPIPDKARRYEDGSLMPDHVFENETDDDTVERYAGMSSDHRKDMLERIDRAIAGDEDAFVGFKHP